MRRAARQRHVRMNAEPSAVWLPRQDDGCAFVAAKKGAVRNQCHPQEASAPEE
jgi:hypothetical protein